MKLFFEINNKIINELKNDEINMKLYENKRNAKNNSLY